MKKVAYVLKHLPRYAFRAMLALSSSAFVGVVYFINQGILLPFFPRQYPHLSYVVYCGLPLLLAFLCVLISRKLPSSSIDCDLVAVEQADNSFLPSYLGYFFVALSISKITTFTYIFLIIYVFTFVSHALYFNPMFLLMGYHFYNVQAEDGNKVFLITKQEMKNYKEISFQNLRRINDYTYIDMG